MKENFTAESAEIAERKPETAIQVPGSSPIRTKHY
jgi:hypothetical protein